MTTYPPNLSEILPNIGVNIPQKIACNAIANPNSVFEVPAVDSNSLE